MTRTILHNARVIDPASDYDGPGGVIIEDEIIVDVGPQVGPQPGQHRHPGARRQKRHHVAGRHDDVEGFTDAPGRQVELGEIADKPTRSGMVLFCRRDERGVDIDPDHPVTGRGQISAHAAGTAPGIEDVRPAWRHRVDEAGLAAQVVTGPRHGPETLDVPRRMPRVGRHLLHPQARFDHGLSVGDGVGGRAGTRKDGQLCST